VIFRSERHNARDVCSLTPVQYATFLSVPIPNIFCGSLALAPKKDAFREAQRSHTGCTVNYFALKVSDPDATPLLKLTIFWK